MLKIISLTLWPRYSSLTVYVALLIKLTVKTAGDGCSKSSSQSHQKWGNYPMNAMRFVVVD
jgi:hypothetical protein